MSAPRHLSPIPPAPRIPPRAKVRVLAGAAAALTVASVVGIGHDAAPRVTAAAATSTPRMSDAEADGRWERAVIPSIGVVASSEPIPEPITPEATSTTAQRDSAARPVPTRTPARTTAPCRCTPRQPVVTQAPVVTTPTQTTQATETTQPDVTEPVVTQPTETQAAQPTEPVSTEPPTVVDEVVEEIVTPQVDEPETTEVVEP